MEVRVVNIVFPVSILRRPSRVGRVGIVRVVVVVVEKEEEEEEEGIPKYQSDGLSSRERVSTFHCNFF